LLGMGFYGQEKSRGKVALCLVPGKSRKLAVVREEIVL